MNCYTHIVITKLFTLVLILIFSKIIRKALDLVNWERLLDQKDNNTQLAAFDETILNVFRNYVPNKYITADDKDPAWINETIKSKIEAKNELYKNKFRMEDLKVTTFKLENLITKLKDLISSTKTLYYEDLVKKV